MKAKSFHCSKSGVVQPLAQNIGINLQCVSDKMPPAYPCDKDKVVFIGIELNGKIPVPVTDFCKGLDTNRTKAVAFYVVNATGDTKGLEELEAMLKSKGVQKVGETLGIAVKSSLFKKGEVTQADIDKVVAWAKNISAMDF